MRSGVFWRWLHREPSKVFVEIGCSLAIVGLIVGRPGHHSARPGKRPLADNQLSHQHRSERKADANANTSTRGGALCGKGPRPT